MSNPSVAAQLITLHGPDAVAFAQSQFTCDVASLETGRWRFGAWLDAQGRVLSLFHLARRSHDQLILLLRGGDAEPLCQAMRRYVFRAKVQCRACVDWMACDGPAMPMHQFAVADENELLFGCGDHAMRLARTNGDPASAHPGALGATASLIPAWRSQQMREGWPWLAASLAGSLLPPWLSLERLHAVAFDKGCYPGQEIVARLRYRGGNKRHLHHAGLTTRVAAGGVLYRDYKAIGEVIDCLDVDGRIEALVVMRGVHTGSLTCEHIDETLRIEFFRSWDS